MRLEEGEVRSLEVEPLRALEELSELPLKREELPQLERPEEDELLESLEEELELPEEELPPEPHGEPFLEVPPPLDPPLFPGLLELPEPQDDPPAGRDPAGEGAGELDGRPPPHELPPLEEPRLPPPKLLRPPPPLVLLARAASGSAARRARMQSIRMRDFMKREVGSKGRMLAEKCPSVGDHPGKEQCDRDKATRGQKAGRRVFVAGDLLGDGGAGQEKTSRDQ